MKDDPENTKLYVIYGLLGIGLVIVAFAFVWVIFGDHEEKITAEDVELCINLDSLQEEYRCLTDLAINSTNPLFCNEVKGDSRQFRCLTEVASTLKNATICTRIPEKQQFDQGKCFFQVAIQLNDRGVCREIRQDTFRQQCMQQVKI
ncbi:MAG: hypothetical protein ABH950_10040 [Candidatus Altiarchaeota archaeon]